jgi:hypothetical protein
MRRTPLARVSFFSGHYLIRIEAVFPDPCADTRAYSLFFLDVQARAPVCQCRMRPPRTGNSANTLPFYRETGVL